MRREISKQLTAVVDRTITIEIEGKESIIETGSRPGDPFGGLIGIQVKVDTAARVRQAKAIAEQVNNDWTSWRGIGGTPAKLVIPIGTNP